MMQTTMESQPALCPSGRRASDIDMPSATAEPPRRQASAPVRPALPLPTMKSKSASSSTRCPREWAPSRAAFPSTAKVGASAPVRPSSIHCRKFPSGRRPASRRARTPPRMMMAVTGRTRRRKNWTRWRKRLAISLPSWSRRWRHVVEARQRMEHLQMARPPTILPPLPRRDASMTSSPSTKSAPLSIRMLPKGQIPLPSATSP
mmetsp:Transcript_12678/g.36236  ORF Transcript_12678/g.36236 Transcript_12678/m.36236 type:complete len:204 (+) Transcript_12678:153-764(+)